jgi:arylsulfatase A-like enzyme
MISAAVQLLRPALPEGRRVAPPVSLTDLASTVAVQSGDHPGAMPGRPLQPILPNSEEPTVVVSDTNRTPRWNAPIDLGDMVSVVAGAYHYIWRGDRLEELYDYLSDPDETRDLARTPAGFAQLARMRVHLPEPDSQPSVPESGRQAVRR